MIHWHIVLIYFLHQQLNVIYALTSTYGYFYTKECPDYKTPGICTCDKRLMRHEEIGNIPKSMKSLPNYKMKGSRTLNCSYYTGKKPAGPIMTQIEGVHFHYHWIVDFRHNLIRTLEAVWYGPFISIEFYHLSDNIIDTVLGNSFNDSAYIRAIDLSYNKIRDMFSFLPPVIKLIYIKMTNMQSGFISLNNVLLPSIRKADLSKLKINDASLYTLMKLLTVNIEELDLSDNYFTHISQSF
ncbi:hypothetical protein GJ496_009215 [Pomphorhynchus laevis]|nr:hypothetical protein GJ496_009215 [Pomphorhynchus laevis]